MLGASELSFGYAEGNLFSDVSFVVERGASLAVLGPSGIGKSSLLSIVGGQLEARTGHVMLDGLELSGRSAQAQVAWIIQSLNVLRHRTALENTALLALIDGEDPRSVRSKSCEVLDQLGLNHAANRKTSDLSGGEIQRITVARALVSERPIILADEPTNQLDADHAGGLAELLLNNARQYGRILIVVTHDEAVAVRCDNVLRLSS